MKNIDSFLSKIVEISFIENGIAGTHVGVLERNEQNIVGIRETRKNSLFLIPKDQKCKITNVKLLN